MTLNLDAPPTAGLRESFEVARIAELGFVSRVIGFQDLVARECGFEVGDHIELNFLKTDVALVPVLRVLLQPGTNLFAGGQQQCSAPLILVVDACFVEQFCGPLFVQLVAHRH